LFNANKAKLVEDSKKMLQGNPAKILNQNYDPAKHDL